jgi:hypothetical protein
VVRLVATAALALVDLALVDLALVDLALVVPLRVAHQYQNQIHNHEKPNRLV